MKTSRLMMLAALASSVAFAQVQVKSGDKTVKVGAGGGVEVQKGSKAVKVKTGATAVEVEGADDADEGDDDAAPKQVEVNTGGGAVNVKSGGKAVQVNTGGGSTTITGSSGKTVTIEGAGGPAPATAEGVWTVVGQGRTDAHVCAVNEDVDISGQGHALTLTGPCRSIRVSGQGNELTTDVAGSIQVSGMNNKVSWRAALKGKKPSIKLSGMGNAAPQLK